MPENNREQEFKHKLHDFKISKIASSAVSVFVSPPNMGQLLKETICSITSNFFPLLEWSQMIGMDRHTNA